MPPQFVGLYLLWFATLCSADLSIGVVDYQTMRYERLVLDGWFMWLVSKARRFYRTYL